MIKKLNIPYTSLLLFFLLSTILTFAQTNTIVIGVDTTSIYITDFEDVHLKTGGTNPTVKWFDIDGNGSADIAFWVEYSNNTVLESKRIFMKSKNTTYFSNISSPPLIGPCDSLYYSSVLNHQIVRNHYYGTVFPDSFTSFYYQDECTIAGKTKYHNPCYISYEQPNWIGMEGYIGFKLYVGFNIYYGWFRVEVLDYDEIIIKEFAANTNNWEYGSLHINEIMASNKTTIADEYGEFDDWIEIYNSSKINIQLDQYYLTDDLSNKEKWLMPDTLLYSDNFIIIWADNQPEQGSCHTNYMLDKDGEALGIYGYSNLKRIDEHEYDEQTSDISIGRSQDGGDEWIFFESPTPGASNETTDIKEQNDNSNLLLYPNPTSSNNVNLSRIINYKVYNIYGQIVGEGNNSNHINISGYNNGVYIVVSDEGAKQKLIVN